MNCKPGDMAWVIRSSIPENIGCIVEVLGPSGIPDYEWSIRFQSVRRLILSGDGSLDSGTQCLHADRWLRPIPNDGIPEEEVHALYAPGPKPVAQPSEAHSTSGSPARTIDGQVNKETLHD